MEKRRWPRWREIRPLLTLRRPRFGRDSKVFAAGTISELRGLARRRTPLAVFDYVDGAAESETTMRRSREDFDLVEFHPKVLRDVSTVDMSTQVLGQSVERPFGLAPTGFTRMMHHAGESAVARAAGRAGIVYTLSTLGTTSTTTLAATAPDTNKWFQLYLPRDRGMGKELIDRAREAGFTALVLTVDTPVPGIRYRDVRNGLSFPPALSPRTLLGMARYPRWWFNVLTRDPLEFASLAEHTGTIPELLAELWDPALGRADVEWVRTQWDGAFVVKGVQEVEDAAMSFDIGADAIVLSNHGGRQLDRAVTSLKLLPQVVEEVGDRGEIYLDGGITSGADVAAAIALGARYCFVGRAYLYGLMAGGEAGVDHAISILTSGVERTMQLLGTRSVAELHPGLVSLRD